MSTSRSPVVTSLSLPPRRSRPAPNSRRRVVLLALHLEQRARCAPCRGARVDQRRLARDVPEKTRNSDELARERVGDRLEHVGDVPSSRSSSISSPSALPALHARRALRRRQASTIRSSSACGAGVARRGAARDGEDVPRETMLFSAAAISSAVISSPSRYFSISSSARLRDLSISRSCRRWPRPVPVRDRRLRRRPRARPRVGVGAHVDDVDDARVLVLLAHRHGDRDGAVVELAGSTRRPLEVGALAVEQVDVHEARHVALGGAAPEAVGRDLDARHAARPRRRRPPRPAAHRAHHPGRRIAGRVDDVQPPVVPLGVREGRGDRERAPLLVLVVVGDRRASTTVPRRSSRRLNSSDSTSDVFPDPRCPRTATLRIFPAPAAWRSFRPSDREARLYRSPAPPHRRFESRSGLGRRRRWSSHGGRAGGGVTWCRAPTRGTRSRAAPSPDPAPSLDETSTSADHPAHPLATTSRRCTLIEQAEAAFRSPARRARSAWPGSLEPRLSFDIALTTSLAGRRRHELRGRAARACRGPTIVDPHPARRSRTTSRVGRAPSFLGRTSRAIARSTSLRAAPAARRRCPAP